MTPPFSAPSHEAWTLVVWRVVHGRENDFIDAWNHLRDVVNALERPPIWWLLLQNQYDSGMFYSFGPWDGFESVASMRRDVHVQDAFQRLVECCHEASPDTCRRVEGSMGETVDGVHGARVHGARVQGAGC